MQLTGRVNWVLEVDTPELRLILQALGDRIESIEQRQEAISLGDKLSRLRAERLKGIVHTAEQIATALQEKEKEKK